MKRNTQVENLLKTASAVKALPEVVVDWNMNRYVGAVASNTPSDDLEGYHVEMFPIESIVDANRPTKGINKARVGQSTVSNDYEASGSGAAPARFYLADPADTYKYWTSPLRSNASGVMPNFMSANFPQPAEEAAYAYDNLTSARPKVVYNNAVRVNKIVITTENTWATAKTFNVQVSTSANPTENQWTTIATNATLGNAWKASGQIVLYYNGNGTALTPWVTTGRTDNADGTPLTVSIRAVRIFVTELEGGYAVTANNTLSPTRYVEEASNGTYVTKTTTGINSHFDLIEISARLEADLSAYVETVDDNAEMGEVSHLYPIGTVTSNEGTLTLSNLYQNSSGEWVPGLFSASNSNSPYANYIEANAEVTLKYEYFDSNDNSLGKIQQFKMYTGEWSGQSDESVTVELKDYSKFFDQADATLPATMWENLKVIEIIWRLLDSVGFSNYVIDRNVDLVTEHRVPVFHTNGESTIWEVLDELAKATQSAIYFDSWGKLRVRTREFAYSPTNAPVWTFASNDRGNEKSSIVSLEMESAFEPNHYKVMYQSTDWADENNGQPTMQTVWEPEEDTVTLRATPLARTVETNASWVVISPDEVKHWPFEGMLNVSGEIMRYRGKQMIYYTGSSGQTQNSATIISQDEFDSYNSKTPALYQYKNYLSGALFITERGAWNSEPARHTVEAEGYSVRQRVAGVHSLNAPGFTHYNRLSRVTLASSTKFYTKDDMLLATRGSAVDQAFFNYGTRFRLLKQEGRTHQSAGLVIHNNTNEDGYYFEFMPSNRLSAADRAKREEFIFFSRINGKNTLIAKTACAIGENIDYELDVKFQRVGGTDRVWAWLNGKIILNASLTGSARTTPNGKFGMFLRGRTRVEFEYLYAIRRPEETTMLEDYSFLDKVERGYTGNQWDKEWTYRNGTANKLVKKKWQKVRRRLNRQFFDDFGPYVHEIREFNVKFEPSPVLHSRLFSSNDWAATVLEYTGSSHGAKFIVANTSRRNAVIRGEDTLSFSGTGDSVDQVFTALGRTLVIEEAEEIVAENTDQIRRRGKVESEITSPWIQSKAMADSLAKWLRNNFSYGNDNITIEVFGNPLIEVGDVVRVEYPEKFISGDYFVTGTNNEFDNGIVTRITARRRT